MPKIAVIGSGPAGIMAALFAARTGNETVIIDTNEHVGRKLLVTGAGRCNLTNSRIAAVRYACEDPVWLNIVLHHFTREDLLHFLDTIGIPTFSTFDGWYYPVSESAHAVVDAFDAALNVHHVTKLLSKQVTGVEMTGQGFNVMLHREPVFADKVIVACGGKAYPSLGSDGNFFTAIQQMGHKIHPIFPALAPVTADMRKHKGLQGVRLDANVTLNFKGNPIGMTFGNIIFTEWGLNGPGVMDLSYLINEYQAKDLVLELNLLHQYEEKVRAHFEDRAESEIPVRVMVQSILPPKMAGYLLNISDIQPETPLNKLSIAQTDKIMRLMTSFQLKVTGTRGFDHCQVSTGGVPLDEVNPETMESLIVPGLFFAGEVVDVIGPCGGYNLHFAFTSGAIAGMSAGS